MWGSPPEALLRLAVRYAKKRRWKMHSRPEHSQLCRFIDESLSPLTSSLEEAELSLGTEREKDLLIVLSQVFRKIQLWASEFDSDSDEYMVVKIPACNSRSAGGSKPHCDGHDCLTNIIGGLTLLLSVESQYVQHLAGNILVAISQYLVERESNWGEYVKSLCVCLELAILNALSCSLDIAQGSNRDASSIIIALQPKLKHATWSTVACVVRVLRTILKHLKQDINDQLLEVYLDLTSASLANVPWDAMDQNRNALRMSSDALNGTAGQLESRTVFHGTLVQLFCSLANQSGWEAGGGSFNEHPVISQISNLIPRLLGWCLGSGNQNNMYMSDYYRHKMLTLMIRLSSLMHMEYALLVSWLHFIHEYFEDLLLLPMTQVESGQDSLEGSPFIASVSDARKHNVTSSHLQRLAVLLFLKCSIFLIGSTDRTAGQSVSTNIIISMTSELSYDFESSSKKKGLSELYWWLQIHLPSITFGASEGYSERCTSFSISFLRLFIDEDDILFELLLLLFCVPFYAKQEVRQDICASQETTGDILLYVTNLLNPMRLFHLFLAELHYDHQVLLDYLISKDTGAISAEYLLRSLRFVCDSWNKFVEFSMVEGEVTDMTNMINLSGKKRKFLVYGSDYHAHAKSSAKKGNTFLSSAGKQHQEEVLCRNMHSRTNGLTFEKAKDCLLSLKKSVQNLHQKNLFPYNPEVLLRRLTRFQELCLQH